MPRDGETRIPLYCACCGREILAELVITPKGRKVVITATRHGQKHCVAVPVPFYMGGRGNVLDNDGKNSVD